MRENRFNYIMAFVFIYILFGFYPGVRIKYFSPIESSKFLASLDYFIKNLFHLWKIKVIASIGAVYISYLIKKRKLKKYNIRNR